MNNLYHCWVTVLGDREVSSSFRARIEIRSRSPDLGENSIAFTTRVLEADLGRRDVMRYERDAVLTFDQTMANRLFYEDRADNKHRITIGYKFMQI